MDQTFQLFSECVLFRNLARREKEALFTRVRIRDFAASECIFVIGSPGDSMMIVLRGTVQISVTSPKGRPHVLALLSPGEIFGEIALLDGRARSADAIAITDCSLAIVNRDDLLAFLDQNPGAWQNIVSVLCERLRKTDGRAAEIALLYEQNWQLAEASQHKSRFIAAASHDLRQPLHALGLFVAQLRDHTKSAEGNLLIERIDTAVMAMSELFNALLDISKLDAGVLTTNISEFPVIQLLKRIESTFAGAAREKGLSLRLVSGSAWVRSDPILLERIVLNLVSNAVRYTASGGIVVGCRRRGETVHIEVWDSGPGIPENQQRNIFREFYRLAGGNTHGGLGLGLAIVDRLCRLLDHRVELVSIIGTGSRFSVIVPMAASRIQLAEPQRAPIGIDACRGKLVVVIDDDALVLDGMGGLLRNWGCRVVVAATLDSAFGALGTDRPDLIICDYCLANGESGIDAIAELRQACGILVPAFLMSGDTAPAHLRVARESGHHLLRKPVDPMALRAMVTNLLKSRNVAGAG